MFRRFVAGLGFAVPATDGRVGAGPARRSPNRPMSRRLVRPGMQAAALAVSCVLVVGASGAPDDALAQAVGFLETFGGAPPRPTPIDPADMRVSVHYDQNQYNGQAFPQFQADHGPNCEAPPVQHAVSSFSDVVYQCNNHIMTAAFGDKGYGEVTLQPNQLLDFSGGTAQLTFDVSTEKDSVRDWFQVDVSRFGDDTPLPADVLVDLAGEPRNGVYVKLENAICPAVGACAPTGRGTTFSGHVVQNGSTTDLPVVQTALESVVVPSEAIRTRFELDISQTHVRFGLPLVGPGGLWWVDKDLPNGGLSWTQGVVTLSQHSYNPVKDNSGQAATWHWGNVALAPAVPYALIKANEGYQDLAAGARTFTFGQAAPAGAVVSWQQDGTGDQVSFDGGHSWQGSAQQSTTRAPVGDDHAKQYRMPVPQGATSFMVRAAHGVAGGHPYARDAAIIGASCQGGCPAPATAPVTPTLGSTTSTQAPVAAAATATATPPTAVAVSRATAFATSTATSTATATATLTPPPATSGSAPTPESGGRSDWGRWIRAFLHQSP